ncbi:MAG: PLP-dependent transferase [Kiritimatiellae bacterium]|nr:PLP-dependent transferase [Kiritimatiellia bacterium]
MSKRQCHVETLAIHAGQDAHGDPATNARAVPVYRTTAYNFRDSKHGADLFGLRELGNIYARLMNPTNDVLAKRIAALEGGAAAQTLSSGTAAIFFTITNIARAGDEIVAAFAETGDKDKFYRKGSTKNLGVGSGAVFSIQYQF